MQLKAPIPHLGPRDLQGATAEQRRSGMQRLEVAADRNRFRNYGAIVEDQRRHPHQWINRGESRRLVLQGAEIHLLQRERNALLRQKDARASRIGRAPAVEELHAFPTCEGRTTANDRLYDVRLQLSITEPRRGATISLHLVTPWKLKNSLVTGKI